MTSYVGRIRNDVSFALCLALVAGCGAKPTLRSVLGAKVGDREVNASLDGNGFISREGETAVIRFDAGKLVVAKGVVTLDGEELAKLPEEAKTVDVDYSGGKLSVEADGKPVVSKELRR